MSIKVLVTGASGQLGRTLKELSAKYSDKISFTFTSKSELDVTNKKQLEAIFDNWQYDYCINCAAYTHVEKAESNPEAAFNINVEAVSNLAKLCKDHSVILIHISTDYVFDGIKGKPYTERDNTNPLNEYGRSKLLGEEHIQERAEKYFIIRTSWLYSIYGRNFLRTIAQKISADEKMSITKSQLGSPTSCNDLSLFILHLIETGQQAYGIYNFTATGQATWYDFAVQISKHFPAYDASNIAPVKSFSSSVKRPDYSVLDNTKAQKIFPKKFIWEQSVDHATKSLIKLE